LYYVDWQKTMATGSINQFGTLVIRAILPGVWKYDGGTRLYSSGLYQKYLVF
jgi:hypothetical protein